MSLNLGLHHLCGQLPAPAANIGALMSPKLARVLCGAHAPWMADVAWLQAVEDHGNPRMQTLGHPRLLPLLQRLTTLDPHFVGAYHFIGTAIDYAGPQYEPAMALLDQGMQTCPQAWRIAFFSGFNAYYYAHDYARAAANLAIAARAAEAPPHTAALATRLAVEAQLPEVGLQLVDTLLRKSQDPANSEALQQRRRLLQLEMQLRDMTTMLQSWAQTHPDVPPTWDALIEAGTIASAPLDPWGSQFTLQGGEVVSIHDSQRLRLAPDAKGRARASR